MELIIKLKKRIEDIIEVEETRREHFKASINKALKDQYIGGLERALKELEELCDEN